MVEHKLDIKLERFLINKYISMPKLFDDLGIEYRTDSNMFCPFHDNIHTPSAKLYSDDNGWCLWCFSEGKMYNSYSVYKRFTKVNTKELAKAIYDKLPDETKKEILNLLNVEEKSSNILPYSDDLRDFKFKKISYTELLNKIIETYN